MHVGWTRSGAGVHAGVDADGDGPISLRGTLMDYETVQIAGDGELFTQTPYLAYKPEDTMIKTYVISRDPVPLRRGWTRAGSTREARYDVTLKYGKILEENAAGDNVFFRVLKETKK